MTPEVAAALLTAIGIGSILGAFFQSRFEQRKQISGQEHELKQQRYKTILMLLLTCLDPEKSLPKTRKFRPDFKDIQDVYQEIEDELLNSVLFASDDVIKAIADFIRTPNRSLYVKTAIAMRRDLWGKSTSITEKTLDVLERKQPTTS